jgi:hypothetical protein
MADKKLNRIVTTIALRESDFELLSELAERKEMSKANTVAYALRLVAALESRAAEGSKLYLEDVEKNKAELVIV